IVLHPERQNGREHEKWRGGRRRVAAGARILGVEIEGIALEERGREVLAEAVGQGHAARMHEHGAVREVLEVASVARRAHAVWKMQRRGRRLFRLLPWLELTDHRMLSDLVREPRAPL